MLTVPSTQSEATSSNPIGTRQKLCELLAMDLGFHDECSSHNSHDFHAFPAKFPPQLPKLFIDHLTHPGDLVLDPMMGSGTTILESFMADRRSVGIDIDPLAVRLCRAKVTPLDSRVAHQAGQEVANRADWAMVWERATVEQELAKRFDPETREFVDYWFGSETQLELTALIREIERVQDPMVREFLELAFSAIIITKSGGVSLARDLAHTRPHRVKGKIPRPAIVEFKKRIAKNIKGLEGIARARGSVLLQFGSAEALPLANRTVDLLITSPPYASNAIDYMRAHKFSLVWLGRSLADLSLLRGRYIGGEKITRYEFVELPAFPMEIVQKLMTWDQKKGLALRRYYSEMTRILAESFRVLKPGKAAIIVVGSSMMRGIDTQTEVCLGEIGKSVGFDLVGIAERKLDRDRRMMPARSGPHRESQIEERMHEEYVVAFLKPDA